MASTVVGDEERHKESQPKDNMLKKRLKNTEKASAMDYIKRNLAPASQPVPQSIVDEKRKNKGIS